MGVKNFSKIFAGVEVKFAQLKNTSVAIDASILAYQSALCLRNISALTDADGNSTIHINVIISKCINFKKNNFYLKTAAIGNLSVIIIIYKLFVTYVLC